MKQIVNVTLDRFEQNPRNRRNPLETTSEFHFLTFPYIRDGVMAHIKFFQFPRPKGQIVGYHRNRIVGQINFFQLIRDVRIAREHFSRYKGDFVVAQIQLEIL